MCGTKEFRRNAVKYLLASLKTTQALGGSALRSLCILIGSEWIFMKSTSALLMHRNLVFGTLGENSLLLSRLFPNQMRAVFLLLEDWKATS